MDSATRTEFDLGFASSVRSIYFQKESTTGSIFLPTTQKNILPIINPSKIPQTLNHHFVKEGFRGVSSHIDVGEKNPPCSPPDPSWWQKRRSNKMAARPAVEPISVIHPVTWVVRTSAGITKMLPFPKQASWNVTSTTQTRHYLRGKSFKITIYLHLFDPPNGPP